MADRYWRTNVNAAWDTTTTTNWAATSGGAGGASVPGIGDIVHFDTNSGASVITLTGALNCLDLICEGSFTGRFAGSGTLNIAGSLTYLAGMGTNTNSGTYTFSATALGKTITSAGNVLPNLTFDGVGGGWTLQDAYNGPTRTITITNGAFNSGNQAISCASLSSSNSNVRSITLGTSVITLSGSSTTPLQFGTTAANISGLTFSGASATFNLITLATTAYSFRINAQTIGAVNFSGVGSGTITVLSSAAYAIGTFTNAGTARTIALPAAMTGTFTTWGVAGTAGNIVRLTSSIPGFPAPIVKAGGGVVEANYLIITDSAASPALTWFTHGPLGANVSGNTGWIFSPRFPLTTTRTAAGVRTAAGTRTPAGTRTLVA